jgi:hypothetical protein
MKPRSRGIPNASFTFTHLKEKSYQKSIDDCSTGLKKNPTAKEESALLNMRGFVTV